MPRLTIAIIVLAATAISLSAQTGSYSGEAVRLGDNRLTVTHLAELPRTEKGSHQGMDICGNYLLSLQDKGIATLYDLRNDKLTRLGGFHLATYSPVNHANVACFSRRYLNPGDKLPLVYITRCHVDPVGGLRHQLYVERIDPDRMESQLVQTIVLRDVDKYYTRTTQWVVDNEAGMLYTYGNHNSKKPEINVHPIMKFRIPPYRGPQDSLVVLTPQDALDISYVEDHYGQRPFQPLIQGAYASRGLIFFPTGVGRPDRPSILYVWDANNHSMQNVIDLSQVTFNEFEDCTVHQGALYIQAQRNLFKVEFK